MAKLRLYVTYSILEEELTVPWHFSVAVVDKRLIFPMVTGCVNIKVTEDFYIPENNTV
jgi:hypothetical protein